MSIVAPAIRSSILIPQAPPPTLGLSFLQLIIADLLRQQPTVALPYEHFVKMQTPVGAVHDLFS